MKCSINFDKSDDSSNDWLIDVFGNLNINESPKGLSLLSQKYEISNELHSSPNSNVYLVSIPSGISLSEKNSGLHYGKQGAAKVVSGPTFGYLLEKEYQILKNLDHPNIIKPLDYKQGDTKENSSFSYMCVPFHRNGELYEQVKNREGLGELESLSYFWQIASAIEYLHDLNIAHRDIKLQNILLDESMNAQLIDFGFSYKLETEFERENGKIMFEYIENQLLGTLNYMAPELIESMRRGDSDVSISESSDYYNDKIEKYKAGDIYALGVALFTMVIGVPPFVSATKEDPNYRNFLLSMKKNWTSRFWSRHPKAKILIDKGELSSDFMNLIEDMLNPNKDKRIRINSVVTHPWTQKGILALPVCLKKRSSDVL